MATEENLKIDLEMTNISLPFGHTFLFRSAVAMQNQKKIDRGVFDYSQLPIPRQ